MSVKTLGINCLESYLVIINSKKLKDYIYIYMYIKFSPFTVPSPKYSSFVVEKENSAMKELEKD